MRYGHMEAQSRGGLDLIGNQLHDTMIATAEHLVEWVRLVRHQQLDRATALYGAGAAPPRKRALGLVDRLIHHEALLLAYSDAFLIAGIGMLLCAAVAALNSASGRRLTSRQHNGVLFRQALPIQDSTGRRSAQGSGTPEGA